MRGTDARSIGTPATLVDEGLACLLQPGPEGRPASVAARAARALLDLPAVSPVTPPWLATHQRPAVIRLNALLERYGGAILADAPGLGKSYVALAVALMRREPCALVVPAVLAGQWRVLCRRFDFRPALVTHESLSRGGGPVVERGALLVVDEAHHFRNAATRRYRALAELALGARVLLVTATPVHNSIGDVVHLLRVFLRDDALAGVGVPSLKRAACGEAWAALAGALPRLVVARSRSRAPSLALPRHAKGETIRVGPASDEQILNLVREIAALDPGPAGALVRMVLFTRLTSSLPSFRESLARLEAFADLSFEARASGRSLSRRDFRRLFPRGEEPDLQLALLPLVLPATLHGELGSAPAMPRLRQLAADAPDPKVASLDALLTGRPARTIVFTASRATARYLLRSLQGRHRVAAVMGARGLFPTGSASVGEVFRSFAPVASGVSPPPPALEVDVLIATDLASEGLNLQDASRVVNYDLPWTPARLAQRVGRIDRLGSPHAKIQNFTFLPPAPLVRALGVERRLLTKARVARRATLFDWCDRLQALAGNEGGGTSCAIAGSENAVLLILSIGGLTEPILVKPGGITGSPLEACRILEEASRAVARPFDAGAVRASLCSAAATIRKRVSLLAASRWRAGDRDQLGRRLIPLVIVEARRAARAGDAARVGRLDLLAARLGRGMTAGEELALDSLATDLHPLTVDRLLAWSERLPTPGPRHDAPDIRLAAAVVVRAEERG